MRRGIIAISVIGLWACASGIGTQSRLAPLWAPVTATADVDRFRIEPLNSAARLGENARVRVLSRLEATATCQTADGEQLGGDAQGLIVPSPAVPAPVEVVCKAGDASARAQVTFTDSRTLPVAD